MFVTQEELLKLSSKKEKDSHLYSSNKKNIRKKEKDSHLNSSNKKEIKVTKIGDLNIKQKEKKNNIKK